MVSSNQWKVFENFEFFEFFFTSKYMYLYKQSDYNMIIIIYELLQRLLLYFYRGIGMRLCVHN